MKNNTLIDILPTPLGLTAIAGFFVASRHVNITLGLKMLVGGATICLLTALFSVAMATLKHRFGWIQKLNTGWVVLVLGFIALQIYGWSTVKWTF